MRHRFSLGLSLALAATLYGAPPASAQNGADQAMFDQLVIAAGASNGAAAACGAAAPDLAQHRDTAQRNLNKFAKAYGFDAQRYDSGFAEGVQQGQRMMADMKRTGTDGCAGVMQNLQHDRDLSYDDMLSGIEEVTDGLPEKK